MSKNTSYRHLETWIGRNLDIAAEIPAQGRLRSSFDRLQGWQQARLDTTYADLAAQPRFSKACRFFLGELYGGGDWQARDRQLTRVLPIMRRLLSKQLLHALGEAMRLQVMSLELDLDMARILIDTGTMDQPAYAAAYRKQARWKDRKEQISLVRSLGEQLDDIVSKRSEEHTSELQSRGQLVCLLPPSRTAALPPPLHAARRICHAFAGHEPRA